MTIAPTLAKYLDQKVLYDTIPHEATSSSMRTAEACHISGDSVAKGVLLRRNGEYLLAVLPASHRIRLPELRSQLGDGIDLANENEIAQVFSDCARGAIPPVGECYGLEVIVDESIERQPEIYLEGGDHEVLIHMSGAQFATLTAGTARGRFSTHA